jgi:hypothetical protein
MPQLPKFLYLSFALLFQSELYSQHALVGNVFLGSQQAVDSFPLKYPDISRIYGRLFIGSADSLQSQAIFHLDSLHGLTYAEEIFISRNDSLGSLRGLHNLDTASTCVVYRNHKLRNLTGLDALKSCDLNGLGIVENNNLETLDGLEQLKMAYNLRIESNLELMDISALRNLEETTFFDIKANARLKSIKHLDQLESVYRFTIAQNDSLNQIGSFPRIYEKKTRTSGFQIYENPMLLNLDAFEVGHGNLGELIIAANPNLARIGGLKRLKTVSLFLYVLDNPKCKLVQFDSLIEAHRMEISGAGLDSIAPFKALTKIGFDFRIHNCDSLRYLNSIFPILDSVYDIVIYDNPNLLLIHEDEGPKTILNQFIIGDDGFSSLENSHNPKLRYITGFNRLESLSQHDNQISFRIFKNAKNDSLFLLSGFNALRSGDLAIWMGGTLPNGGQDTTGYLGTIDGFRKLKESKYGVIISTPPNATVHTIKGFDSLEVLKNATFVLDRVLDTLDAFAGIKRVESPIFEVSIGENCFVSPGSFAKLEEVKNCTFRNGAHSLSFLGFSGVAFPGALPINLPGLKDASTSSIITETNDTSLIDFYPLLSQVGYFSLEANKNLKHFSGLNSLQKVVSEVLITGNDALIDCPAICNILKAQIGSARIDNALAPCSDRPTVTAWCDTITFVAEPTERNAMVYPNPIRSGSLLTVQLEQEISGEVHLSLETTNGVRSLSLSKQIESGESLSMRLPEMLPTGTYFLHLRSQSGSFAKKIMVLER